MLLLTVIAATGVDDRPAEHDGASVLAVGLVFAVMVALFSVLLWVAFRAARRGRATWSEDQPEAQGRSHGEE